MASQSYQLSFVMTVALILFCLILFLVLLAAAVRAIFVLAYYIKHLWRLLTGPKSSQEKTKSSRGRTRKQHYEDTAHYADDEITDSISELSERSMSSRDPYSHVKSKEE